MAASYAHTTFRVFGQKSQNSSIFILQQQGGQNNKLKKLPKPAFRTSLGPPKHVL